MKGPILFFRSKPKQALGMKARLVRASPSAGSGPATSRPSFDRSNRKGQKKITTKAEEDEEGSSITTITTDSTCTSAFTANSPTFSMNMRDSKRFETSPSSSLSEDSFSVASAKKTRISLRIERGHCLKPFGVKRWPHLNAL